MHLQLLEFYRGRGNDPQGRSLETIWGFAFKELEEVHDYIQWLFPTDTPSRYHPLAPRLDAETAGCFRNDEFLQAQLLNSLEVMLKFYGLALRRCEVAPSVFKSPDYPERRKRWQGPHNHNLLRLTRILESLRLLGLGSYSLSLYLCLEQLQAEVPGRIPFKTLLIWRQAAAVPGPPPRPTAWQRLRALF